MQLLRGEFWCRDIRSPVLCLPPVLSWSEVIITRAGPAGFRLRLYGKARLGFGNGILLEVGCNWLLGLRVRQWLLLLGRSGEGILSGKDGVSGEGAASEGCLLVLLVKRGGVVEGYRIATEFVRHGVLGDQCVCKYNTYLYVGLDVVPRIP